MNCHGFNTGVTFALRYRLAVDDPISGQDALSRERPVWGVVD
jgi:hypothetical protein